MRTVDFVVYGTPAPQGSKRHVGHGVMIESSKKVRPWRQAVKYAALENIDGRFEGPLAVHLEFGFDRPKGHYGTGRNIGVIRASAPPFPVVRPDLDKLARATLDGLGEGGAFADDAQIVSLMLSKVYLSPPRCQVFIWEALP